MTYEPIDINYKELTIMDVPFPDEEIFRIACDGIGSCMFEGWVPTKKKIEVLRDLLTNKISREEFIKIPKGRGSEYSG